MLSKYNREELIGSGTFGNVWLVTPKTDRNICVMKEVKLVSMTEREREQARTEVSVLSRCNHKNIIKYMDAIYDKERGMLCIVMEYAEGGDLYTTIAKQKGTFFEEDRIISWFVQICLALEYIHSQNILHRDLKSQNIFLTRFEMIKVGDFGIARVLKENHELATTAIGTPYYLSPEICLRKPYSFKSDIWALGCVLFEMTALSHPFQAKNFHQLITNILKSERRDLPKHCGPLIEDLVDMLLKSDPEERPSASQILSTPSLQFYSHLHLVDHADSPILNMVSSPIKEELSNTRRHSANDILEGIKDASTRKFSASPEALKVYRSLSFGKSNELIEDQPFVSRSEAMTRVRNSMKSRIPTLVRNRNLCSKNTKTLKKEASVQNCSPDNSTFKFNGDLNKIEYAASYHTVNEPKNQDNESDCGYHSADTSKRVLTAKMFNKTISKGTFRVSPVSNVTDDPKQSVKFNDLCNSATSDFEGLHCRHAFHCNQCMLDFLWKSRIRSEDQVNKCEQAKLRSLLHSVFSRELFDKVYYVITSEWENDRIPASVMLNNLTKVLTIDQVQHIPLVVQLVQLELVTNTDY